MDIAHELTPRAIPSDRDLSWLAGGEMGARMRDLDWSANPMGPPETWSVTLQTLVRLMLASQQPMFIAWGDDRSWLYNDAFIPILGKKHPSALGKGAMAVWAEARDLIEPIFAQVFAGVAVGMNDFDVFLDRQGKLEEAHFSFSCTPARETDGSVAGLFGACIETTAKVVSQRRAVEERERLARLFDQAPVFMALLTGPEHRIDFANPSYMSLVGHRPVMGRTVADALPDVVEQGYLALLDKVYSTGEAFRAEASSFAAQAEPGGPIDERYLDFVYQPVTGAGGRTEGILVLGADVTERTVAERAIREQARWSDALGGLQARFNELEEPNDIAYAAAEMLGRTLGTSRAGYGAVDLVAETIVIERDWNAPGIRTLAGRLRFRDYGSYIEELRRGETVIVDDAERDPRTRGKTAEGLKAMGAQAFVNIPVTEDEGFVALLYITYAAARTWRADEIAFVRDVAKRTRMAVERRRAEARLRALTESLESEIAERTAERDRMWSHSRDLLAVVGADGILRRANPAWQNVLGHAPAEVEGKRFRDFAYSRDEGANPQGAALAATVKDVSGFEGGYRHKDGSIRWISWHMVAEGDHVYAYGRDITAETEQAAALAQTQEALRQSQKLEAMGQLTGGVAHDFNNLLTPIMGSLDLLQRRSVGGPREQRLIEGAIQSAERAKVLVHRLLAFSRRQPLKLEPIDMGLLVHGMSDLIGTTTGPQIKVTVEIADDLPFAVGDANQLEMAILNLSVNARDAMPEGGTLRLAADAAVAEPDNDLGLSPGDYLRLSIADSGTGMEGAVLGRAIEPFFSTKGIGKGTGLGLSMVHGLAAQLGGGLGISSRVGHGTDVELWLPVSAQPPAPSEVGKPAPAEMSNSGTILLVDDEAGARETTAAMLKEIGFDVIEASSGEEALGMLKTGFAPDLLVSDHLMPGISGEDLAYEARTLDPRSRTLIVSGFADLDRISPDVPRLSKPFRQTELAAIIADLLPGRRDSAD